jgi:Uma2 family endonuclease
MTTLLAKMPTKPKSAPRQITLEQFLVKYDNLEDGFKYEWNNGVVEKTKAMNQIQALMQVVLLRFFFNTKTFKEGGLFTAETDMKTSPEQLRRPDLAIYAESQVQKIKKGENQIALWVGEVISPSDTNLRITQKLDEYFDAGVKVVWHILPEAKQVYVYTSPDDVKICRGKTICSAAPALDDFEISAEELFS